MWYSWKVIIFVLTTAKQTKHEKDSSIVIISGNNNEK